MRLLQRVKDGGPLSRVHAFFLIEAKKLFSAAVLRFADGSREAIHSHAFNAVSWVITGKLTEYNLDGTVNVYRPSLRPILTRRDTFHKVVSTGNTYVLTFRGPWSERWIEWVDGKRLVLTHGRRVIG